MGSQPRTYQPAFLLRFFIRLEDSEEIGDANTFSEIDPFPEKTVQLDRTVQRISKDLAAASARRASGSPDGKTLAKAKAELRQVEKAKKVLKKGPPKSAAVTKEGGDGFSIQVLVVPTSCEVEGNGLTTADTASATFPWLDAPFYSYIMRGASVDILAGTITEGDFAQANSWVLPLSRAKLIFRGFVDKWDTNHDDTDATVSIECRSFESVLMDAKINPLAKVYRPDKEERISVYVNRILQQFPQTSGKFGGDNFLARWTADPGAEPSLDRKLLIRSLQTAASRSDTLAGQGNVTPEGQAVAPDSSIDQNNPAAAEGTPGSPIMPPKIPGNEMSVWDLIVQACEIAGCLPVYSPSLPSFELPGANGLPFTVDPANTLLLRPAQTIFEDVNGGVQIPGGAVDGFNRQFSNPQDPSRTVQSEVRFMIWGHNIKSMKTSRKLGHINAPAVEVVSYNPDAPAGERRLSARFPNIHKKAKGSKGILVSEAGNVLRASQIGSKGEYKVDKVVTKVVRGIRSQEQLEQIAVSLYNEMSRQEVSVTIETTDMASYIDPNVTSGLAGGSGNQSASHNDDPDLLKLTAGSPCRVTVARQVQALDATVQGTLVLTPLSEVFERRSDELSRFLQTQNGRFQHEVNSASTIKLATDRLARAMASAKLLDVFYVRTIKHSFDASDGYHATLELVNYAPVRSDPANLSKTDQLASDLTKLVKEVKTLEQKNKTVVEAAKKRLERQQQVRKF